MIEHWCRICVLDKREYPMQAVREGGLCAGHFEEELNRQSGPDILGSEDEIDRLLEEFERIGATLPVWAMRLVNGLRHEWKGAQAELDGWKDGTEAAKNEYAAMILRSNSKIEQLQKERDDANKTASDAKFEIDRLVPEVHRYRTALFQIREICQEERLPSHQIFEIADEALPDSVQQRKWTPFARQPVPQPQRSEDDDDRCPYCGAFRGHAHEPTCEEMSS